MYLVASVRLSVRPFVRPSVRPSVCPSVRPSVTALAAEPLVARLCRVQQRTKKSHYQSQVFVCVSSYLTDAVDRLLIQVTLGLGLILRALSDN